MSTPFLNDALVRSALTRKIAALETSTRRKPSRSQVDQLNGLTRTYHRILATPKMQPETAREVLSDVSQDSSIELQYARHKQQTLISTLSTMLKEAAETSASITANIK